MTTQLAKILLRRGTKAAWASANPTLSVGELGFESDTLRFKIGDGSTVWTSLSYESGLYPSSTYASPTTITAAGGVSVSGKIREVQFIKSNGGAISVTANPRIAAGDYVGEELTLVGTSDTDTVSIANGQGVALNGTCVLRNHASLYLVWDGLVWVEVSRNDN